MLDDRMVCTCHDWNLVNCPYWRIVVNPLTGIWNAQFAQCLDSHGMEWMTNMNWMMIVQCLYACKWPCPNSLFNSLRTGIYHWLFKIILMVINAIHPLAFFRHQSISIHGEFYSSYSSIDQMMISTKSHCSLDHNNSGWTIINGKSTKFTFPLNPHSIPWLENPPIKIIRGQFSIPSDPLWNPMKSDIYESHTHKHGEREREKRHTHIYIYINPFNPHLLMLKLTMASWPPRHGALLLPAPRGGRGPDGVPDGPPGKHEQNKTIQWDFMGKSTINMIQYGFPYL